MSSRDNFRQAARELFGLDAKKGRESDAPLSVEGFLSELPEEDTTVDIAEHTQPQHYDYSAPPEEADSSGVAPQGTGFAGNQPAGYPVSSPEPQPYQPQAFQSHTPAPVVQTGEYSIVDSRRETSIIAKGTTIVGRVRTDGHIEIMGRVEGNVDAEGNVAVSGRVAGNVKGQHLEMLSCQIKGNLTASAGVFVNNESVVVGDITAENVIFDGRVKGNVEASQAAEFNRNSYIVGDISAKTIAIEPGAVINGMIRTLGDRFDDGDFDELGKF